MCTRNAHKGGIVRIFDVPHNTVLSIQPVTNARVSHDTLYGDTLLFDDIPAEKPHQGLVLFEWHGCAFRSPVLAWWSYAERLGPMSMVWGAEGLVDLDYP